MAWCDHNFSLYKGIAENLEIPLSALKSAETPKIGPILIFNVKKSEVDQV